MDLSQHLLRIYCLWVMVIQSYASHAMCHIAHHAGSLAMAKRGDPRLSRDYKAFRLKVLARDQWSCHYCQQPANTVDHIIPVSKAPDLVVSFDNAVACCQSCNSAKGSRNQGVFLGRKATPPVFSAFLSPTQSKIHEDSPFTAKPVNN